MSKLEKGLSIIRQEVEKLNLDQDQKQAVDFVMKAAEDGYTYVEWPFSQDYMGKDWFQEEAIFDVENNAHFIPNNRLDDNGYDKEE